MNIFQNIARLRVFLEDMERDAGLTGLSEPERRVYFACVDLSETDIFSSKDLREHILTVEMTQPTFHRSLLKLIEKGFVQKANPSKTKLYRLTQNA